MSGEKSLYKYTNLHRMVNELNVEVEAVAEIDLNEDRQVIAAVGGALMTVGMGLAELATEEKLSNETVAELLQTAAALATPTAVGFAVMTKASEGIEGASIAVDLSEVETAHVFIKGLEEVAGYVEDRQRVKPDPL